MYENIGEAEASNRELIRIWVNKNPGPDQAKVKPVQTVPTFVNTVSYLLIRPLIRLVVKSGTQQWFVVGRDQNYRVMFGQKCIDEFISRLRDVTKPAGFRSSIAPNPMEVNGNRLEFHRYF